MGVVASSSTARPGELQRREARERVDLLQERALVPRRDADPRVAAEQIDPRPGPVVVDPRELAAEDHEAALEHEIGLGEREIRVAAAERARQLPRLVGRASSRIRTRRTRWSGLASSHASGSGSVLAWLRRR